MMNNPTIITGIKPIKSKPTYNQWHPFNKRMPVSGHNFPLTNYTDWDIYGYKRDPFTGIKRPHWLTKRLPTGAPIEAKAVGLDGFFTCIPKQQVI